MAEAQPKVTLISYTIDPEQTVVAAVRQCYSKVSGAELKEKTSEEKKVKLLNQIVASGHTSTIEHASFTFSIEGVSRALTHQLVRHRIASYSHQSQRYVESKEPVYIVPPKIKAGGKDAINRVSTLELYEKCMQDAWNNYRKLLETGIEKEDARYVLPNAAETKIVVTMNARALLNFFEKRLCNRAQWEIHVLAFKMLTEVKKVAPNIFKYAGPTCETEKICWEGNLSCGKWKAIKGAELRERHV